MDNQEKPKYHTVTASEWSGLSTKGQILLVLKHGIVVVTWQGDAALVVRYIDSDPEIFINEDPQ